MKLWSHCRLVLLAALVLLASAARAAESISIMAVAAMSPFNLDTDPTPPQSLTVRTDWDLHPLRDSVTICVYMDSPMIGTGGNPDTIPAANVQVDGSSIVGGGVNCAVANARLLSTNTILTRNGPDPATRSRNGYKEDTISVRISGTSGLNLAPDTYSGTINLIALAF
jgi:hypothetical protein